MLKAVGVMDGHSNEQGAYPLGFNQEVISKEGVDHTRQHLSYRTSLCLITPTLLYVSTKMSSPSTIVSITNPSTLTLPYPDPSLSLTYFSQGANSGVDLATSKVVTSASAKYHVVMASRS